MKQEFTRIAVKVGSNVLTRRDGTLDVTRMSALVDQIAELHKSGVEIILISSGAVASGRSEVHPQKKLDSVDQRQLFSAVVLGIERPDTVYLVLRPEKLVILVHGPGLVQTGLSRFLVSVTAR